MITIKKEFIKKSNQKEEKVMMKKFLRGNRRLAAVVMAFAITISGVSVTPQTAEAANYTYTSISGRNVDVVDGVTTLSVDGATYQLSRKRTVADAAADQYGTVWMRYKNDALYFASYEIEGKNLTKHRLVMGGSNAYAEKLLFKGSNPLMPTHYVDNNGKEVELPNLDYLRKQLGKETSTPSPTPATPSPTPATPSPTPATPSPTPVTPSPSPVLPSQTPNVVIDSSSHTEFTIEGVWEAMLSGKITYERAVEIATLMGWKIDRKETQTTDMWEYYGYDENGRLAWKHISGTVITEGKETGSGQSNINATDTGKADVNVDASGKDKVSGTIDTDKNVTITDNRPSTPTKVVTKTAKKGIDHIKQSGGKYEWIMPDGGTKITFTVNDGKFKFLTLNGKKVVAAGVIKKNKVIILRIKGGKTCVISITTHKMAWLKEKTKLFTRDRNAFVVNMILKSGKKVNVKNLAVKKGKYVKKSIHKIKYTISYKKLIKK